MFEPIWPCKNRSDSNSPRLAKVGLLIYYIPVIIHYTTVSVAKTHAELILAITV